jgi:hypothetical protein
MTQTEASHMSLTFTDDPPQVCDTAAKQNQVYHAANASKACPTAHMLWQARTGHTATEG